MYHTGLVQSIFLAAAVLLFILGLYLIFINKKFKVPGIIFATSSILYFGLTFLLYNSQLKLNNASSQSSNAINYSPNTAVSSSTPVTSSSTQPSRFLNIPTAAVQNTDIKPLAAVIASDVSQNSNANVSNPNFTAKLDNPKPTMGQTINITVTGPAGAYVYAIANYKDTSVSNSGVIGSDGTTKISFAMGNAKPGDTVKVDVMAPYSDSNYSTQLSFTEAN
ncbi:hypothetical protein [Clostridium sp. JN-1]|uniref:hypothetical protein n=1 Tax=Clostridium sp. JN-1 TaxID=2483110 RepID=UPI000F0B9918|nr:hypothetical protein [Clostridium sp. JN-1]